ncbi:hypothetical protein MOQ_002631 [Trypanosoma cruzi marinkellei]|uniref:RanBP2-type domain-containing protein n=1 Tax=Trypanosoma cruzi marinkellei TaxID=85056 RepID=K2NEZ5_TRYCR|nr:hypothetical protein MOQ_002631 [Trypanosoma cruzi marinkellei]
MSNDPSDTAVICATSDTTYMEEIILQNEALLLEVEQLRSVVKGKGLDQLQQLRGENERLQQLLKLSESQLAERTHQLEVLESAYNRFDGVHSAIHELTEQQKALSETKEQCISLEEQNTALKTELVKVSTSEEEVRKALQETERSRHMLEEEVTKLRAAVAEKNSRLENVENLKCSAEEALEGANASIAKLQAHSEDLEAKYEALKRRLRDAEQEACEASRIRNEKHNLIEKELEDLRAKKAIGETRLMEAERVQARLQEELRLARNALAAKEQDTSRTLLQQRDQVEMKLKLETGNLQRALEEKEQSLRQQVEQNIRLKEELSMLSAEKDILMRRKQGGPVDVLQLQNRLKELSDETSKKEALQQRFQEMLKSSTATNSDIKHLFAQMLDYQEQRDEEMRTMIAIERIKTEDMKNMYELNLQKLRAEEKSLVYEIQKLKSEGVASVTRRIASAEAEISHEGTQYGGVATGNSFMPQADANPPMFVGPTERVHPVARAGGSDLGGTSGNIANDLWQNSLSRADRVHTTATNYEPAHLRVHQGERFSLLACPRCTLLNQPGITNCEVCGASL